MIRTMRGEWLGRGLMVAIGMLWALAAQAQAVEPAAPDADALRPPAEETIAINAMLDALQRADEPALQQFYDKAADPALHLWAAMLLERLHMNLQGASEDAQLCQRDLLELRPALAYACGQFEAGNLQLAGRGAEARAYEQAMLVRFAGKRVDRQLAATHNYLDAHVDDPQWSVSVPDHDVFIATDRDRAQPAFDAQANGHRVRLMVDTGASNLVLGRAEAERLGVRPLGRQGQMSGWLAKGVVTEQGVLDTLSVNGITWHQLPVTVTPAANALLGGNLLVPLGTIKISQKGLTVYAAASAPPACGQPMLARSDLFGNGLRLIPRFEVEGAMQPVMLDTGNFLYLLGSASAMQQLQTGRRATGAVGDVGGTHPFAHTALGKVHMTISGQPMEIYFSVLTDSTVPHPLTLGAGALRDMDFLLDFRRQQLCFDLHTGLR